MTRRFPLAGPVAGKILSHEYLMELRPLPTVKEDET